MARPPRRPFAPDAILMLAILCLYLFVVGLYTSITVIEQWLRLPNYLTDTREPFFAGALPLAIAGLLGLLAAVGVKKRVMVRLCKIFCALSLIYAAAFAWLHWRTMDHYRNNPQYGVCKQYSKHTIDMYVWNSDWCDYFDKTVQSPSPIANRENPP
jgi:uncharacterized membrane protein